MQTAESWIGLRGKQRRPLEDRLFVRLPGLFRLMMRWLSPLTLRMPARWRLRQLLVESGLWRSFNALRRRDIEVFRLCHQRDCVYEFSGFEGWTERPAYRGHDGLAALAEDWVEMWSDRDFDLMGWEEPAPNCLLVHIRVRGSGRASGAMVELNLWQFGEIRDGLGWRFQNFTDRDQAVAAARDRVRPEAGVAA